MPQICSCILYPQIHPAEDSQSLDTKLKLMVHIKFEMEALMVQIKTKKHTIQETQKYQISWRIFNFLKLIQTVNDGLWQVSNIIVIVYHQIITVKSLILIIWSFIKCLTYRWSLTPLLTQINEAKIKRKYTRLAIQESYNSISTRIIFTQI